MTLGGGRYDARDAPSAAREAETVRQVKSKRRKYKKARKETKRRRSYALPVTQQPVAGVNPPAQGGRLRRAVETFGQAAKAIVTDPFGTSAAVGAPVAGIGGASRQAAGGILRNLPGIGRYLGRTDVGVGRYLAERSPLLRRALPVLGGAAAGVALEKFSDWALGAVEGPADRRPTRQIAQIPTGGPPLMQQTPLGTLSRGQEFPGGPFVVKTWDTYPGPGVTGGGAWPIFALLSDGRIVVSKPNGSWKVYRPKKNLVISSNPRLRDIRKLDRMHKRVTKMMKSMVPRPTRRK